MGVFSTRSDWNLFVYVSVCKSACFAFLSAWVLSLSFARLLLCLLAHLSKKQRKEQSAVVDSNRAYKQRYKSSLQTSNSIQRRLGLSNLHLAQVRQAAAMRPLTVPAVVGTATLWPPVWKARLPPWQLCILTHFLLFSSRLKKTTGFNWIRSSFPLRHNNTALQSSSQVVSIFVTFTRV